jgi:hypothetical protein
VSDVVCKIVERPADVIGWQAFETWIQPGWLVQSTHEALKDLWSFRCPVCRGLWSMRVPDVHQIISRDPLTVAPSWLCPGGCHYFIRDGRVQS